MINFFLSLASFISTLLVIYGGAKYILARGNKEKEARAGKLFLYNVVILIVLSILYGIFNPPIAYPPLVTQ